jgi:hypothetical protein
MELIGGCITEHGIVRLIVANMGTEKRKIGKK